MKNWSVITIVALVLLKLYSIGSQEDAQPQQINAVESLGGKHSVTDTMAVSSNFYDTSSDAWAGQAGHMHLGTDFSCSPGDNIYAPFDMFFINTSFAPDMPYWGWRINARFTDGTLFYSGHLQDVIEGSEGHLVAAGTVIGHCGKLFHTHIKLEPLGSPNPCEGPGTCIDFEEYYATH